MNHAPTIYSGSWDDLYATLVEPNLISRDTVTLVHGWLQRYCAETDALFLVRFVRGLDRRKTYLCRDGTRFAPCDNSPAWELHALLWSGVIDSYTALKKHIPKLARHFHDVKAGDNMNRFGWYVAHIYSAKNGDTAFQKWDHAEVVQRFLRAIHPCNIFFVPRQRGRELGEHQSVIAYFAERYASRYAPVWHGFRESIHGASLTADPGFGETLVQYRPDRGGGSHPAAAASEPDYVFSESSAMRDKTEVRYEATRLLFKRSVIETLAWNTRFEIVTPFGTFRMTRRQFQSAFPNVVESSSYTRNGVYSYAKPPAKAYAFRLTRDRKP